MTFAIIITSLVSLFILATCTGLHYEYLRLLSHIIINHIENHRLKMAALVYGVLFLHLIEIIIFAFGYMWFETWPNAGYLEGKSNEHILEYIYFSLVTYTSLGYGDITPHGHIRFLTSIEVLAGLTLIAWSASFMYMKMLKYWTKDLM